MNTRSVTRQNQITTSLLSAKVDLVEGSMHRLNRDIFYRILHFGTIVDLYRLIIVNKAMYSLVSEVLSNNDFVVDLSVLRKFRYKVKAKFIVALHCIQKRHEIKQLIVPPNIPINREWWTAVLKFCPRLTHLSFPHGTPFDILYTYKYRDLYGLQLQSFIIRNSGFCIHDKGFKSFISDVGSSLTYLELGNCVQSWRSRNGLYNVAYMKMDHILQYMSCCCPNLVTLKLRGKFIFTDVGILSLVDGCKKLETLELKSCGFGQVPSFDNLAAYESTITQNARLLLAKSIKNVHLEELFCGPDREM